MSLTPNYGMTIPASTDTVNLLTQNYPNFNIIDTALKNVSDSAITVAVETKSGTVHNLVRSDSDRAFIRFTATSDYIAGDTFTVDGNAVTVLTSGGTSIPDRGFVINSNVVGVLVGSVLTLLVGGGLTSVDASDVDYDNTVSGLTATNVQDAIDEIVSAIPSTLPAEDITFDNTGSGLVATNVQTAILEVNAKITTESVSVTADGVKSSSALGDALFALIDHSKITKDSCLVFKDTSGVTSYYRCAQERPTEIIVSYDYVSTSPGIVNYILKSTGSVSKYWYNGSTTDVSSSIPNAGCVLEFIY